MDEVSIGLEMEHENASFLHVSASAAAAAAADAAVAEPVPPHVVSAPAPGPADPLQPMAPPSAMPLQLPVAGADDDQLRVSYQCKATKCFRLQWESESACSERVDVVGKT